MNNFYNDYNERSMNDHFSMIPVLAQEFVEYVQQNSDKFELSVDLPHGTTTVYEREADENILLYREMPEIGCNSRIINFRFNGFEYYMHVFLEIDVREWIKYDPVTDKNEKIDCQTFVEEYERFKRKYNSKYFNC